MKNKLTLVTVLSIMANTAIAQISGEFQNNNNFFTRDTTVRAANNPLYDNLLSGSEAWLALRYSGSNGFNANVRFDIFNNSNILNPQGAYSNAGLGMFNVSKEWEKLTITAGHIYDQIGSGIIYRAYEDRALLIDNATFGIQAKYDITNNLTAKAFTGQVRNLFDRYKSILKGANVAYDYDIKKAHLTTGIGVINRTLDETDIANIVNTVNALPISERFAPNYNMYAGTIYNTLNIGNVTLYTEAAVKNKDVIRNATGSLQQKSGNVLFATVGWAKGKLGINASAKRTENFVMRTSPFTTVLRPGFTNWQPVIATIRPQRLIARYTPPSQDLGELSTAFNSFYTPNDNYSFNATYTFINGLNNTKLYRELYTDVEIHSIKNSDLHIGLQVLNYNQKIYQTEAKANFVNAITPFAEYTYKLSKTRSIKLDAQYMAATGDYGSWIYALLEYDIAPSWAFAIGDMYNTTKGANYDFRTGLVARHYPNVFVAYTKNAHRFTAQYVKQVDGINCTGGVCRYEPAFSGFKIGINSSF
jgi:Family of unknown function (DUF6029)